ncbi:MAG: FAD:protein FMN transferase [Oscillospiraceae bacterium]
MDTLIEYSRGGFIVYKIYALNKNSGEAPTEISPVTMELLEKALGYCSESQGLFDITVSPLVKLWNVTGENPKVPLNEDIEKLKPLVNYKKLALDKEKSTGFLEIKGASVDLGGVAKGFLAEKALDIAKKHKVTGYISVGGNMAVLGKKPLGGSFKIGIKSPRSGESDILGTVKLHDETMATTGDYERFFIENGERYHHVLDPKTGFPAKTDLISVTVISKDGSLADFLSTYIFMLGSGELPKFFDDSRFLVLAVTKDKKVLASPELWNKFTPIKNQKDYEFLHEK